MVLFIKRSMRLVLLIFVAVTFFQKSSFGKEWNFEAPVFKSGTYFQLLTKTNSGKKYRRTLIFERPGIGGRQSYRFKFYDVDQSLQIVKDGRKHPGIVPIKFPLTPNKSWEYERSYKSSVKKCKIITEKMKATVSPKIEQFKVAGKTFKVVRVTHRGRWTSSARRCGGGKWGPQRRDYLYSPVLGWYVRFQFKSYGSGNKKQRQKVFFSFDRKMTLFENPNL